MKNVQKVWRIAAALILVVVAMAAAAGLVIGAPAGLAPDTQSLVGLYQGGQEGFLIRERDGSLELLYDIDSQSEAEWNHYTVFPLLPVEPDTYRLISYGPLGKYVAVTVFERDDQGRGIACQIGEKRYQRQFYDPEKGLTFRIKPLLTAQELHMRTERAKPPAESGIFLVPDLVEVAALDPTIQLDIRYATDNNFMGMALYDTAKAFLQRPAAEALVRVHAKLEKYGYGLIIHDAYRPWYVTKMFWDATPDNQKMFVADPAKGSRHNRGGAVDISLYDRNTGKPVPMISGYDEFSPRAYPTYPGGTTLKRWQRDLLRTLMEGEGFTVYPEEWWHFDYTGWQKYSILNLRFEDIH